MKGAPHEITGPVAERIERELKLAGAGSEDIGYAVMWSPAEVPGGMAIAWMFMFTIPSLGLGEPPLCVTTPPQMCGSVPADGLLRAVVADVVPKLRRARQAEENAVRAEAATIARARMG